MTITGSSLIQVSRELLDQRVFKDGTIKIVGDPIIANSVATNLSPTNYFEYDDVHFNEVFDTIQIKFSGTFVPSEEEECCAWKFHSNNEDTKDLSLIVKKEGTLELSYGNIVVYLKNNLPVGINNTINFAFRVQRNEEFIEETDQIKVTENFSTVLNWNGSVTTHSGQLEKTIAFQNYDRVTLGISEGYANDSWDGDIYLPSFSLYENGTVIYTPSARNSFKFTKVLIGDGIYPLEDESVPVLNHVYECPVTEITRTENNVLLTTTMSSDMYLNIREIALYYADDTGIHVFSKLSGLNVKKGSDLEYNLILHIKLDINVVNTVALPEIVVKKEEYATFSAFKTVQEVYTYIAQNLERMIKLNALGVGDYKNALSKSKDNETFLPVRALNNTDEIYGILTDNKPVGVGYDTAQVIYRSYNALSDIYDNFLATNTYAKLNHKFSPQTKKEFNPNSIRKIGNVLVTGEGEASHFSINSYIEPTITPYLTSDDEWGVHIAFLTGTDIQSQQGIFEFEGKDVLNQPLILAVNNGKCFLSLGGQDELILSDEENHSYLYERTGTFEVNETEYYAWQRSSYFTWGEGSLVLTNDHVNNLSDRVTIINGIASEFTFDSSLTSSTNFNPSTNPYSLVINFKTGNFLNPVSLISTPNMEIIIENGTYKLSGTGLSQTCISTEVLQEDTEYSCQLTFDGTYTSLVHKTVDETLEGGYSEGETVINISGAITFNSNPLQIGNGSAYPFNGSINLVKTNFSYGDFIWYGSTNLNTVLTSVVTIQSPNHNIYDITGAQISKLTAELTRPASILNTNIFNLYPNRIYYMDISYSSNEYKVRYSFDNNYFFNVFSFVSNKKINNVEKCYIGGILLDGNMVPFFGSLPLTDAYITDTKSIEEFGVKETRIYDFVKILETNYDLLSYYHIPDYDHFFFKVKDLGSSKIDDLEVFENSFKGFGNNLELSAASTLWLKVDLQNAKNKVILYKGNIQDEKTYLLIEQIGDIERNEEGGILSEYYAIKCSIYYEDQTVVLTKEINTENIRSFIENPISLIITRDDNETSPTFKMYKNNELLDAVTLPNPTNVVSLNNSYITNYISEEDKSNVEERVVKDILFFKGCLQADDIYYVNNIMDTNF